MIIPRATDSNHLQTQHISFSEDWRILFARGTALGLPVADCALDTENGTDQDVSSAHGGPCEVRINASESLQRRRGLDRYDTNALLGPSNKFVIRFYTKPRIFDWVYHPTHTSCQGPICFLLTNFRRRGGHYRRALRSEPFSSQTQVGSGIISAS
jgi:hypothetical protein